MDQKKCVEFHIDIIFRILFSVFWKIKIKIFENILTDISAPCGSTKQDKTMKRNSHQASLKLFFFVVRALYWTWCQRSYFLHFPGTVSVRVICYYHTGCVLCVHTRFSVSIFLPSFLPTRTFSPCIRRTQIRTSLFFSHFDLI